jgi:Flp pilus assembly protein TadD
MNDIIQQAIAAQQANRLDEAERLYLLALQNEPQRADAHFNLGMIYRQQDRVADALRAFSLAADIKPDFDLAWLALSECAGVLGKDELAVKASKRVIELMPNTAQAWIRHGLTLNAFQRDEEAIAAYRRVTELEPKLATGWINLSVSLKNAGQFREAETSILNGIANTGVPLSIDEDAEADYGLLHWHLALSKLGFGEYREGFAYFRARFKGGTSWKRLDDPRPLWRGENLQGKTILVTAEQGHGDMLMMARYLPLLKSQGAKALFQTHPALLPYFSGWNGVDEVISTDAPLGIAFDFHVPVFDLPYRFQTTRETIPSQPYLPLPEADDKTRLSAKGRKIGVVWAGQSKNIRDKIRSIPLDVFGEIFSAADATFYNLTYEVQPEQAAFLKQHNIINLVPQIRSFADTARYVSQLDLIITCDTAIAHLAGGMGKPVWILLPFNPDWRWGYEEKNTPWYPTARLFRQNRSGDWADVMQRVREAL